MQQLITIDDNLLKNASRYLESDDINDIVNTALRELVNNYPIKTKMRRQPPASIANKGKILGDLVESCVDNDETAYLLANPENKARLLNAIAKVDNSQLIDVDVNAL